MIGKYPTTKAALTSDQFDAQFVKVVYDDGDGQGDTDAGKAAEMLDKTPIKLTPNGIELKGDDDWRTLPLDGSIRFRVECDLRAEDTNISIDDEAKEWLTHVLLHFRELQFNKASPQALNNFSAAFVRYVFRTFTLTSRTGTALIVIRRRGYL